MSSYSFGQTATAAARLRIVADVFAPEIRAFLSGSVPGKPKLALDLGCGPGYTTKLLAEVLKPGSAIGMDISPEFLRLARSSAVPGVTFVEHDVTTEPFPHQRADLIFVHFVLTHLPDRTKAIQIWARQLVPGGLLLVDEVESITTEHPVLKRYLGVVADLVEHHGGQLYVGSSLDRLPLVHTLRRRSSSVVPLAVRTADAATMFAMNLSVWRNDPFILAHYPEDDVSTMAGELETLTRSYANGDMEWGLRQIVFEAVEQGSN